MPSQSNAFWQHVKHIKPLNLSSSREGGRAWKHQERCLCVCVLYVRVCMRQWGVEGQKQRTCTHWRFFSCWMARCISLVLKKHFSALAFFTFSDAWVFPNRRGIEFNSGRWRCTHAGLDSHSHKHLFIDCSTPKVSPLPPSWIQSGRKLILLTAMYYKTAMSLKWSVHSLNPLWLEMYN